VVAARIGPARGLWIGGLGLVAAVVGLLAGLSPKFALTAAIGAGFVLLVAVDLAAGLAIFGFFSFLELLELGSVISVGKLGGVLLALGWLAVLATRHERHRDFFAVHPWMSITIGAFLGWSLLSAGWAAEPAAAFGATGRYALDTILFLIVFTAIRARRDVVTVAVAFVAGAVAATLYGLAHLNSVVYGYRLTGAGLDPNELAAALVAGVTLSGALFISARKSPGLRLAVATALAFCLAGIFLTVSRGGMVALAITLVAAIVLSGRWRLPTVAATVLIAATAFVYFGAIASPQARERIGALTQGESRVPDGRITIWKVGWRMVEAQPIAGVGAGNFPTSAKDYLLQPGVLTRSDQILIAKPQPAHNTYLGILAELGVVGLALFLTVVGFSVAACLRAAHRFRIQGDRSSEALARGFAIALVGTLAADFFISQELSKQLWLLLGFGPALLSISSPPKDVG
jgi:O-antigen ligase